MRILSEDGRISNAELAERIGLSASACHRRVAELERLGVIKGYRAILDPEAMSKGFIVYVAIGLSDHTRASQEAFEAVAASADEVTECHNVTGTVEYLLRVEVADLKHYKRFHTQVLGMASQVNSITTYVVMESPKDNRA